MRREQEKAVREASRQLLLQLWDRRHEHWSTPPAPEEFVRRAPEMLITKLLNLTLEKPEEIPTDTPIHRLGELKSEIAGIVDRKGRRIVVAQKYRLAWRRFTTAHEIGHWVLHPNELYHRDRPLIGGERANTGRPEVEQEADLFAAELLMPAKILRKVFSSCFGGPIRGDVANRSLAFQLSSATSQRIDPSQFAIWPSMRRALLIANVSILGTRVFPSLAERFAVSPTAMAIQLIDLGLVS